MQRSLRHQSRNRPIPLTISVVDQMMARFHNLQPLKSQDLVLKGTVCFEQVQDLFKQTNKPFHSEDLIVNSCYCLSYISNFFARVKQISSTFWDQQPFSRTFQNATLGLPRFSKSCTNPNYQLKLTPVKWSCKVKWPRQKTAKQLGQTQDFREQDLWYWLANWGPQK